MAYQITTAYVIAFDLVLTGFLVEVLRRSGATRRLQIGVGFVSAAWIGALAVLIHDEMLYPESISPIAFFATILGAVGAFTAIGILTPVGRALAKAPQELLMLPQGLRVFFGAGFLIEGVLGVLPQGFAIADGITHITAAFLCLKAAVLVQAKAAEHGELWTANLFGLIDIVVVASGLALFLLGEVGPHHNVMLAALFAAPVFINLHLVSLWKLVADREADGALPAVKGSVGDVQPLAE